MSIFHLENEDMLDAYGTSVLHVSYFFPKSLLFFFRRLFYVITQLDDKGRGSNVLINARIFLRELWTVFSSHFSVLPKDVFMV